MGAQFLTAMLWGRIADSRRVGRKSVLLIGLIGTSLSCLGFGFSTSFWQALAFRTLGGATNGNIGVMRTMYAPPAVLNSLYAYLYFAGSAKSSERRNTSRAPSCSSP